MGLALNEEFLKNVVRGGELLAAGNVSEAKEYLERAHQIQPKNEKGQNLLGLTYFKLGLYDRAAEIYEALVRENPVDATLRVNLGLVYLKTQALTRAIHEFETAVDLSPEHKKAHNYLGLALAQLGRYQEARSHFVEAGSESMAEKMDRALLGETDATEPPQPPVEQPAASGSAGPESGEVAKPAEGQAPGDDAEGDLPWAKESDWSVHFGEESSAEEWRPAAADGREGGPTDPWAGAWSATEPGKLLSVSRALKDGASSKPPLDSRHEADHRAAEPVTTRSVEVSESAEASGQNAAGPSMQFGPEELHFEEVTGGHGLMTQERPGYAETRPEAEGISAVAAAAAEAASKEGAGAVLREEWHAGPLSNLKPGDHVGESLTVLSRRIQVLKGLVTVPFEVREEGAAITVVDELLTRVEGLLLVTGAVKLEPELKRFRGRPTEQPFGVGPERLMRAKGNGVLVVSAPPGRKFAAVELGEDGAYFREELVFAFEEPVTFENWRVPSDLGDVNLVHLGGRGKILLRLDGALRSHQVGPDLPATVPLERLVGWFGNVMPKVLALAVEEGGRVVKGGAELSGEGYVLFTAPMG